MGSENFFRGTPNRLQNVYTHPLRQAGDVVALKPNRNYLLDGALRWRQRSTQTNGGPGRGIEPASKVDDVIASRRALGSQGTAVRPLFGVLYNTGVYDVEVKIREATVQMLTGVLIGMSEP